MVKKTLTLRINRNHEVIHEDMLLLTLNETKTEVRRFPLTPVNGSRQRLVGFLAQSGILETRSATSSHYTRI
jgi:hypothetical protein